MAYPTINPFETGQLKVSDIHKLQCVNIFSYQSSLAQLCIVSAMRSAETKKELQVCPSLIRAGLQEAEGLQPSLVVFLHGGPGGGCDPKDRCFFNPAKYKVNIEAFLLSERMANL